MKGWTRGGITVVWAAVAVLTSGLMAPAAAQRSLSIQRFDVTVEVEESGWVDVREEIDVRFEGSWNGIFRLIPVEYRTPQGFSYRLFLDDVSVTGPDGEPYEYWNTRDRHYRELKIRVPGASDATRTVVIEYRVPNALKFWDEYDELYWNVTGDEWEMPIARATATVILPPGVEGTRTASWTGGYGSTESAATVTEIEDGFYFMSRKGLNYREGLTIAVAWNPGIVTRPSALDRAWMFLKANWFLIFPVVSFLGMYRLWSSRGRDPRRLPIAPQYEPPDDLSPGEAGTLLDNKPDMRDITAGLVDMAVRGYVRIEEIEEEEGLLSKFKNPDYRVVGLRPRDDWKELKDHERRLLTGVFGGGTIGIPTSVRISSLKHEFYRTVKDIKDSIYTELVSRDYYERRPDTVLATYLGLGTAVLVVGGIGVFLTATYLQMSLLTAILAAVGSALPIWAFGFFMPARTGKGTRVLERVLGFEEFLERVETERYRRMITSPEMFEKYLPYAMAFGVADKWAKAFEDLYTDPPDWYRGTWHGGFRPVYFVDSMAQMSSSASSAFSTGPRSSGGSGFSTGSGGFSSGGFSGGGFSGGGFGGGGGGGW